MRVAAMFAALCAAACGRQASMDDQMKKDLDAAAVSTMELAPNGGGQHVVSALEQLPYGQQPAAKKTSPTKPPEHPQTVQASNEPAATRPVQRPAVNRPPPGGFKTIGEVLKNAPFPIKP